MDAILQTARVSRQRALARSERGSNPCGAYIQTMGDLREE